MTATHDGCPPFLIAGGGIGGLSAACALARRGFQVIVAEAAPGFSEIGAGIQIGPNGSRLLQQWGLGEGLDREACKPSQIVIADGLSGQILTSVPLGKRAEARYGAPYYVAERRLLHRLLLEKVEATEGIALIRNFYLASFRENENGVAIMDADGRMLEGRALIGADGIHSRTRFQLFGVKPDFSGRNAWRATTQLLGGEEESGDVWLWLGPEVHLVHYQCGPGGPVNAVAVTTGAAALSGWGTPGNFTELQHYFDGWAETPRRFLERFNNWMVWPLLELPPLRQWSAGCVTLLGDAAHPLMPFLASGAVMAIEDAAVLAREVNRNADNPAAAFSAYETERRSRTRQVQRSSARMGEIYHMRGPMRAARNMALAAIPEAGLIARNDWLYGYCADD